MDADSSGGTANFHIRYAKTRNQKAVFGQTGSVSFVPTDSEIESEI